MAIKARFTGVVQDRAGNAVTGRDLRVWVEEIGGQRITGLRTWNDELQGSTATTDADGNLDFATVEDRGIVWVETPDGDRRPLVALEAVAKMGRAVRDSATALNASRSAQDAANMADQRAAAAEQNSEQAASDAAQALVAAGVTSRALSTPAQILPKVDEYESWPELCVTAQGNWIMTYSAGKTHVTDPGDRKIVVLRSTDEGANWRTERIFGTPGEDMSEGQVSATADGALVMIIGRNISEEMGGALEYIIYRSSDDGRTWTEIIRYPWTEISPIGDILLLANGDLLAPWHGEGWGMLRSSDNGFTWELYGTANGGPWMREGRIVQAASGTLIGIGRNGNLDIFFSEDNGLTWTQGVDTGVTPDDGGNTNTQAMWLTGDTLEMVWISRTTFEMFYTHANTTELLADPTAWAPNVKLADIWSNRTGDIGYPAMVATSSGDLYVAWYAGQGDPSIQTAILSGSAAPLIEAAKRSFEVIGFETIPLNADVTTSTGVGMLLNSFFLPLSELAQSGRPWVRVIARILPHTVPLTLTVGGAEQEFFAITTTPSEVSSLIDSGWQPIPPGYHEGGSEGVFRFVSLNFRGRLASAGSATVTSATTVLFGRER